MELLLNISLGLALSAACGFRVFVPLLVMSAAALSGYLTLSEGFQWIGTYPALVVFATASILEIASYAIPWIDNIMDAIAGPVAVIAGILATASIMVQMDPLLKWSLAIIAGGGAAAIFHGSTALLRGASTALTGGLGNHAVAGLELGTAIALSVLAVVLPLVAMLVVVILLFVVIRSFRRKLRAGAKQRPER